jgi:phage terminase large subunit-like protein
MLHEGLRSIFSSLADAIESEWIPRPEQLPPGGDWSTWLILAGRGAGKTRAGAEWVRSLAEAATVPRIALVGPTAADVRDTMVEGESGLLAIAPDSNRPTYEPTKRRLTWGNGVQATLFSSEEPDRLRAARSTGQRGSMSYARGATSRRPGTTCNLACASASDRVRSSPQRRSRSNFSRSS